METTGDEWPERLARAVPTTLLAVGACSLAWNEYGSVAARDWLPYAAAAALVAAAALWSGAAQRLPRSAAAGAFALLLLAAWDGLSVRWSPAPSLARDEALLVALYAIALALGGLTVRAAAGRRLAAALVIAPVAALALGCFVALLIDSRRVDDFTDGRLTFPISYVNAQAAVFLVGFWPCVALAARRSTPALARAAFVGASCAMLAGWLMTQSKGGGVSLAVAGIVFFALNPARLRALVPTVIPALLVGASYLPLTQPFRADRAGTSAAIRSSAAAALVVTCIGAAVGLAYAALDRRLAVSRSASRVAGAAVAAAASAAVVAGIVLFFVVVRHPGRFAETHWRSFKHLPRHEHGSSHLATLGSNRYDFWRVDLAAARDHPLAGIGARGFADEYLLRRRTDETPQRGHSLELDAFAETGIVGVALLVAGVGLPLARALRVARRTALTAGLAAAGVYGAVHTSVDWIWTFPAFGLLFFALLGLGAATHADRTPRPLPARAAAASGIALVVVAVVGFVPPWLSARFTSAATDDRGAAAATDLRRARRLDPLSVDPLLAEATLAPSERAAVPPLVRAVAKEPRSAALHYRLGLTLVRAGERRRGRVELARARALDPRDPLIEAALARARSK